MGQCALVKTVRGKEENADGMVTEWRACRAQRVLLMDEISTGLDSATTYTVTEYLRTTTHYLNLTTLVSLLQPPPEVPQPPFVCYL